MIWVQRSITEHQNKKGKQIISLRVARTGVEPVNSALRGRRPEPLDERAIKFSAGAKITQ